MEGTIATRAGERQRVQGGVRPFSGARGASSTTGASPRGRAGVDARLPSEAEIREAGETFLSAVFGAEWDSTEPAPDLVDAVLMTPIEEAWVAGRIVRLRPMSDGPMRLIPKRVWNLSMVLMQSDDWFEAWKYFARRCPRDWLVLFCGVAMLSADGELRALDNRRTQSMLALGVLTWQLAEYDPAGDKTGRYPYIVRGLPYGAYQHLVSYWQRFADGAHLRVPSSTTLFGTHVAGGRFDRAECGYLKAWKQAGIATTSQPNGWGVAPGLRGRPRKNEDGEWECWAFVELRLRIAAPNVAVVPMGPPPVRRRLPAEPATGELDAMVNELERSWYPDEQPTDRVEPTSTDAAAGGLPGWMTALLTPSERVVEREEPRSSLEASTPDLRGFLGELQQKSRERKLAARSEAGESTFRESSEAITLTAAVNLLPGEMSTPSSAKFLEAFRAYEKEKKKREAEKALREQGKRKPPS
ncbi:MAG TPA: hypothetical protein VFN67_22065 [Polyangiales bacterium]|nr:hypothetical protein [Polyangiales bacterium]